MAPFSELDGSQESTLWAFRLVAMSRVLSHEPIPTSCHVCYTNRAGCIKFVVPGPTKTDQCPPKAVLLSPPFAVSTALQNRMTSDNEYVRMLPTFYQDNRYHPVRTTDDLQELFYHEFDLKRSSDIHGYPWLAGPPDGRSTASPGKHDEPPDNSNRSG